MALSPGPYTTPGRRIVQRRPGVARTRRSPSSLLRPYGVMGADGSSSDLGDDARALHVGRDEVLLADRRYDSREVDHAVEAAERLDQRRHMEWSRDRDGHVAARGEGGGH